MNKHKLFMSLLALILVFALSGCAEFGSSVDSLLIAPKLTGDIYEIQQALENSVGSNINLRYPRKGDNLSAFILNDNDLDGYDEALAFYSYENDNEGMIYLSYIDKIGEEWSVIGTGSVLASDVERVDFADLDGDGCREIVIGWSGFSALEKTLTVYTVNNQKLTQRLSEPYNEYIICDIMEETFSQLLLVNLNTTEKTSTARLYHLDENGIVEEGSASLDGSVISYSTPVESRLGEEGQPAVYIDASKSTGTMITEIIYFSPPNTANELAGSGETNLDVVRTGALVAPFHDGVTSENEITARPTAVASCDIDKDGVIEVPLMTELPGFASRTADEKMYVTAWRSYDGNRFNAKLTAIMNYQAGYYFIMPAAWQKEFTLSSITVSRSSDYSLLTFFEWNSSLQQRGNELFRIQVFARYDWENRDLQEYSSYVPIGSDKENVYAVSITNSGSSLSLDEAQAKEYFRIIDK